MKCLWSSLFLNASVVRNNQQIRYLPRWHSRRPAKVIPSEEYDEKNDRSFKLQKDARNQFFDNETTEGADNQPKLNSTTFRDLKGTRNTQNSYKSLDIEYSNNSKINWKQPRSPKTLMNEIKSDKLLKYKLSSDVEPLTISKQTIAKKSTFDMLETVIDEDGNCVYTKMKDNDARVTKLLVELKSKKEKEKSDLILLEGKRLIKDALDSGCQLKYIIFSRLKEVEYLKPSLPKIGAKLYKMPYNEMQTWSGLTTNPGIMGVFKIPDLDTIKPPCDSLPITIICDNIREGSNLGAVLRTCSGVGVEEVVLTKGCVNVWDSKVLRSACGAHFKLRIRRKQEWDTIIANLPANSQIYIADNQMVSTVEGASSVTSAIQSVHVMPYYSADFTVGNHIVLIIGGETEGISESSYMLAKEKKGVRLNIPLSYGVDSLNTGIALGIIAFEIKKQLWTKKIILSEDCTSFK